MRKFEKRLINRLSRFNPDFRGNPDISHVRIKCMHMANEVIFTGDKGVILAAIKNGKISGPCTHLISTEEAVEISKAVSQLTMDWETGKMFYLVMTGEVA